MQPDIHVRDKYVHCRVKMYQPIPPSTVQVRVAIQDAYIRTDATLHGDITTPMTLSTSKLPRPQTPFNFQHSLLIHHHELKGADKLE